MDTDDEPGGCVKSGDEASGAVARAETTRDNSSCGRASARPPSQRPQRCAGGLQTASGSCDGQFDEMRGLEHLTRSFRQLFERALPQILAGLLEACRCRGRLATNSASPSTRQPARGLQLRRLLDSRRAAPDACADAMATPSTSIAPAFLSFHVQTFDDLAVGEFEAAVQQRLGKTGLRGLGAGRRRDRRSAHALGCRRSKVSSPASPSQRVHRRRIMAAGRPCLVRRTRRRRLEAAFASYSRTPASRTSAT